MKKLSFPVAAALITVFVVLLVTVFHFDRVLDRYREIFLSLRVFYVILFSGFAFYFWKRTFDDFSGALFSLSLMFYCVSMMWLMPLYEAAYFQCAIGSAFLKFKRSWIHPAICFFGFLLIILTYKIQDELLWELPATERGDWIASVAVFWGLSWAIQKFAISAYQKDADNLRRFSVIGRDAARLTHDLKGLLSSPMILLESFRSKSLSSEFYERQMTLLIQDMDRVRESIQGINRLVILDNKIQATSVNGILSAVLALLQRRLKRFEVSLPEDRILVTNGERLHSIFFNLLINSVQAFEAFGPVENGKIEIYWDKNTLIFKDNAGGFRQGPKKIHTESSGLGLELIRSDVQILGADFIIVFENPNTIAKIKFSKRNFT